MTSVVKPENMRRIPISFTDETAGDDMDQTDQTAHPKSPASGHDSSDDNVISLEAEDFKEDLEDIAQELRELDDEESAKASGEVPAVEAAGPVFAELLATRSELKRVQSEATELRDSAARRQADFENFRKRTERERSESYNRAVADLVAKLLPVLDNLRRAVDTEASVEASESDEFRHFLNGVDLIHKQLGGVLEALGVKPVPAVGELFDPHLHEAVLTEESDEHEPDTVMQEIVRGYRLGDKLLRPALVKVAVKK